MYLAGLNEFSRAFEETLKGETTKVDWEKLLDGGSTNSEPQADNPLNQKYSTL